MSRQTDQLLATRLASWFHKIGCQAVTIHEIGGRFDIYYTLMYDVMPQPPATVMHGSVVFPAGSQQPVITAYLKGMK